MLRGLGLIVWGVVCDALFVLIFVSHVRTGRLIPYLLMAATLSAALLSVSAGRKLLMASRNSRAPIRVG